MLLQLNPPLPMSTPKGDGLAHAMIDYGIEHDLCWVVFLDESAEVWTFKNQDVRALKNMTHGRIPEENPCGCHDQQTSETVSQYTGTDKIKDHRGKLYEWAGKLKPDPMIPWNSWSDYLPDEGKFYFNTRRSGGPFCGQRCTTHLNMIEIKLDARYRMEDHGMIVGWKPYD